MGSSDWPMEWAKGERPICPRCKRPNEPWPFRRPDVCSPPDWVTCIRSLALLAPIVRDGRVVGVAVAPADPPEPPAPGEMLDPAYQPLGYLDES